MPPVSVKVTAVSSTPGGSLVALFSCMYGFGFEAWEPGARSPSDASIGLPPREVTWRSPASPSAEWAGAGRPVKHTLELGIFVGGVATHNRSGPTFPPPGTPTPPAPATTPCFCAPRTSPTPRATSLASLLARSSANTRALSAPRSRLLSSTSPRSPACARFAFPGLSLSGPMSLPLVAPARANAASRMLNRLPGDASFPASSRSSASLARSAARARCRSMRRAATRASRCGTCIVASSSMSVVPSSGWMPWYGTGEDKPADRARALTLFHPVNLLGEVPNILATSRLLSVDTVPFCHVLPVCRNPSERQLRGYRQRQTQTNTRRRGRPSSSTCSSGAPFGPAKPQRVTAKPEQPASGTGQASPIRITNSLGALGRGEAGPGRSGEGCRAGRQIP